MGTFAKLTHAAANPGWVVKRLLMGRDVAWKRLACGLYMKLDPLDWMDRAFFCGDYEEVLVSLIKSVVRQGDLCVDVGAQKGYITLHLAKAVGDMGQVIAIEPDPRCLSALRENCRFNGLWNVESLPFGLSSATGQAEFALSSQLGWSSIYPNETAASFIIQKTAIQLMTLDEIVRARRVAFVKIDAEGAEGHILRGAAHTLARSRPIVSMEVNKGSLRAAGESSAELYKMLRTLGYRIFSVSVHRGVFEPRLEFRPMAGLEDFPGPLEQILLVHSDAMSAVPFFRNLTGVEPRPGPALHR